MGDTLQVVTDIATLGSSYQARRASEKQDRYLSDLKNQQQAQLDEIHRQGPAPTIEGPTQSEVERKKRAALAKLRGGLSETIKTRPGGLQGSGSVLKPVATTGKKQLGN